MKKIAKVLIGLFLSIFVCVALSAEPSPTLRVVTSDVEPFSVQENEKFMGFSIDLWALVAKKTGLKYTITNLSDHQAVLDAVADSQADVGLSALSYTVEREIRLDFTHHYFDSGLQIMTRKNNGFLLQNLLAVFTHYQIYKLFFFLLLVILVIAHLMWLIERKHNQKISEHYFSGIGAAAWWAIVTMTTVGYGDIIPRTRLGKFFGVFAIFTSITFLTFLFATLTSTITLDRMSRHIRDLQDLHGQKVGVLKNTVGEAYLKKEGIAIIAYPTLKSAYQGLQGEEVDAVVDDAPILKYQINKYWYRDAELIGSMFASDYYGFVVPNGSPYRDIINRAIIDTLKSEDYRMLYMKWFGELPS